VVRPTPPAATRRWNSISSSVTRPRGLLPSNVAALTMRFRSATGPGEAGANGSTPLSPSMARELYRPEDLRPAPPERPFTAAGLRSRQRGRDAGGEHVAEPVVDRVLKDQKWLDKPAGWTQNFVQGIFKALGPAGRPLKDLLHGQKLLHHPLHPALTDVPLGAWTTGVIADYMAITTNLLPRNAGTVALAVGVVVSFGAAASGYTDFTETYGLEMRTAFVHGLTMTLTVTLKIGRAHV